MIVILSLSPTTEPQFASVALLAAVLALYRAPLTSRIADGNDPIVDFHCFSFSPVMVARVV
jgi:hypothetical protein